MATTVTERARRFAAWARRCSARFGTAWRRSLQVRVVTSCLALSAAVVFVLGMLLQVQITDQLVTTKRKAAIDQTAASAGELRDILAKTSPGQDTLGPSLSDALDQLVSARGGSLHDGRSGAGEFEPVISATGVDPVGTYATQVPSKLRQLVEGGTTATQITTLNGRSGPTTFLVVGTSLTSASSPVQLYLLFPLTSEKQTLSIVQVAVLVAGLVLVLLLAGIVNLVLRQVVRPVRQAAEIADRFATGDFSERMRVVGEDDVARLGDSYNSMADNIAEQIRRLEEFSQLQRRFTSDVSHELRTPLTTVRMAADVLYASREQFPSGLARSTELMVDELDRFEALLTDLLEISRLDAGVEELSIESVDVLGVVRSAADSVRGIAGITTTEIVLDVPENETPASIDARRVERILRNLLANAVDHGEGKPVRVVLRADRDAVAIAVRDYGVGLRVGEEELVFNRFWRADPSRNRRTGGTGLGLAISLEDARLHGGWLEAWGRPDQGACFRLTLPRTPEAELTASPVGLPPVGSAHPDAPETEPERVTARSGGEEVTEQ
ncbi:MtrAB system histidine kinase MtrB [Sciscionella sediminilitoris]|uniref:MtrAB system histidine kinase MtrB n=1 Tax=Sciscionella sediminilitoris TaxID=1445613 RepID=UPI00056AD943|nr:MtrAB system histidine kinase MtrB [Sciscionella sp. SE31]